MRILGFVALGALMFGLISSHELLQARPGNGNGPPCDGEVLECADGERFSRRDCECVPKGSNKQLVCHFEIDDESGEVAETGEVLNVSEESAHLRDGKHPDDCMLESGKEGDDCMCGEES